MHNKQAVPTCPSCGETKVRRSQSRLLDRLQALRGYKPFRCRKCETRFYWNVTEEKPKGKGPEERVESRKRKKAAFHRELLIYVFALVAFAGVVFVLTRDFA